jgi:hypothetical protein
LLSVAKKDPDEERDSDEANEGGTDGTIESFKDYFI